MHYAPLAFAATTSKKLPWSCDGHKHIMSRLGRQAGRQREKDIESEVSRSPKQLIMAYIFAITFLFG